MSPTDQTRAHVIANHVHPARVRGETQMTIRSGTILKELGWTNRTPSVCSTLGSASFQREAGLELIEKRGGPASGGPSTTWQFVYRILPAPAGTVEKPQTGTAGGRLQSLFGVCAETFRALGGGEEYLKRERQWGPDAWERYESGTESPEQAR